MENDIKFPDTYSKRGESQYWFPVIVNGDRKDCIITEKFIDNYLRGDTMGLDEDIFKENKGIINKLVENKINNEKYNTDGSLTITEYDKEAIEFLNAIIQP